MTAGIYFSVKDATFVATAQSFAVSCYTIRSQKGPMGTDVRNPVEIRSYDKLVEVYGPPVAGIDDHLIIKQALDKDCIVKASRVSHFTDLLDEDTNTALFAEVTLQDRVGAPGPATQVSAAGPFQFLTTGGAIDFHINGATVSGPTFNFTKASQASEDPGAGATGWALGGLSGIAQVVLPGQTNPVDYTVTFDDAFGSGVVDPANYTQSEVINQLVAAISGVVISQAGNTVVLTTDKAGSGATINLTGDAFGAAGLNVTAAVAGTGNVTDNLFVTAAEVATITDAAAVAGLEPVSVSSDIVTFQTTATGSASVLGFVAPSAPAVAMGFVIGAGGYTTGADSALATDTLQITSESRSSLYNGLQFTITTNIANPATFDLVVPAQSGAPNAEAYAQCSMDPDNPRYIVSVLNQESRVLRALNLSSTKPSPFNMPAEGAFALTGGADGLAGITAADFLGTTQTRSGVHGFDSVADSQNLFVPQLGDGSIEGAVAERDWVSLVASYCATRQDMIYFFSAFPKKNDVQDLVDYRYGQGNYSAGDAFDTQFLALYGGAIQVKDFQSQTREIEGSGRLGAVLAFNDTGGNGRLTTNYGTWMAPAGAKRAQLDVLGVGKLNVGSAFEVDARAQLETAQINSYANFGFGNIVHDERNTQIAPTQLRDLHVRRFLIDAQRSSVAAVRKEQWDPLDPQFFLRIYNLLTPLYNDYKSKRAIDSFRIECDQFVSSLDEVEINNLNDLQNGKFICKIFLKVYGVGREITLEAVVTALSVSFDEVI